MPSSHHHTHVVPTHLQTPETVLSLGGLSLSARQFLLLLVGAALAYDLWKHLEALLTVPGGILLAAALTALPFLGACALAFGRLAGRDLASWGLVLLRYLVRPTHLVWHSVRFFEQDNGKSGESEDIDA
jgi:hypothetical protein